MPIDSKAPLVTITVAALLCTVLASAMALCAVSSGSGQQPSLPTPELSLNLTSADKVIQAGSPVRVAFTVTNITDHTVEHSCYVLIPCDLQVHNADGHEPPDTRLHRRFRPSLMNSPNVATEEIPMGRHGLGVLKPGEAQTNVIDVNTWYDLSQPGIYTIQVVRTTKAGEVWQQSNAITVKVVPVETAHPSHPLSGPPFSLNIRTYGAAMTAPSGNPNFGLMVDTKNISDHRVTLATERPDKEQAGAIYKIDVRDVAGSRAPEREAGRLAKIGDEASPIATATRCGEEALSLSPGQEWWDTISPHQFYALNKPGKYTIQIRRWDNETKTWVKSNIITVTVVP